MKNIIPFFLLFFSICVCKSAYAQLQFVENKGQWESQIKYKAVVPTGAFFLEQNGFTVLTENPTDLQNVEDFYHGVKRPSTQTQKIDKSVQQDASAPVATSSTSVTLHSHAYKVNFLGSNANAFILPDKALPTYDNYFIGNDKSKWQGGCKIYQGITYKDVYPNIDVRYYTSGGNLKYDFIIRPGGNVNDIQMQYIGADKLQIKNNELMIGTSVGDLKELYPYTYQLQGDSRQTLDCKYIVKGNVVKFKIQNYQAGSTIVIDPTLVFCSFTASTSDNWGYTATPGPDGSFFAGGIVFGQGYPASTGAFQTTFGAGSGDDKFGPYDIGIIKFSPNGAQRVYATYLGGDNDEQPHSMICDAQGNLIVAGRSKSTDYPLTVPKIGTGGDHDYDIIITKFNSSGTALIGSVKIGGSGDDGVNIRPKYTGTSGAESTRRNYGDDARSEVIIDQQNNIYVASCTQSTNAGSIFPVKNSPIQTSFGGGRQDGVILKFSPDLSTLDFSTLFGGRGDDACFVLSINPVTKNLYVAGATTSPDLPGDKTGVINSSYQGGETDGFVTEIKSDGSAIVKTTYMGTSGNDMVYGVQFDKQGFPYIMGTTTGQWPVINANYSNDNAKQFISKLQPDLSGYVYSTVFGTSSGIPNLSPVAFLVDRCQNVYVSGWGGALNTNDGYPSAGTTGMPVTSNAIQSRTDGSDFYFFVLEKNATSQLFGSFFGQIGGFPDHVDGGTSRFDENGVIYQAMCANCFIDNASGNIFPTTPGVWGPSNRSDDCNEAAVKIEMNFTGVSASIKATIDGKIDTIGCAPLNILFTDTLAKGKQYHWNFNDGTPEVETTVPSVNHTFVNVGNYRVRLVSVDSSTCNISDTVYIDVRAGNNDIAPDFIPAKIGGCESLTYQFANTTTAVLPVYTDNSFLWNFGDGTPSQRANFTTVTHTYQSAGTYTVTLISDDTTFCNAPDTVQKTIKLALNVKAQFTTPATGCAPYTATFTNTSVGGVDYEWSFGDGATSTQTSPTHKYNNVGSYTIRLVANDPSTCNKSDTAFETITLLDKPSAGFTYSPDPSKTNTPTQFINTSLGAVNYIWNFGDGSTSTETNPIHQYNATDTFHACLIAINQAGCADTICQDVPALVTPLLDVPNAFTPGKFGTNAIIKVVGFGVGKMDWRIYNRWGQMIFESTSLNSGWDGTFKGALQPIDVYTYTLEVEFTNGKKVHKTGDISLLR